MARVTRRIGLSLGADICWPAAYEGIVRDLKLELALGRDTVDFAVERITVEPYDLQQPVRYDVVLDRLTHWFHTSREWIKKAVLLDATYVLNNPWAIQSMEKQTTYVGMMRLGLPVPKTWMVPPREHTPRADLQPMLDRYARLFDLGAVGEALGYPLFMKPYDGGAWEGVTCIKNEKQLRDVYDRSGNRLMHLQAAVPFDLFVRSIGIGPTFRHVRYDPDAPLHKRYVVDFNFLDEAEWSYLTDQLLTINAFFNWEFNSCESLRHETTRVWHPIDYANACPDFQVTSLHFHWPGMVKDMVAWSLFCAATKRTMEPNLDWAPFFAVAKKDLPLRERLAGYAAIARKRLEADRFEEWRHKHLPHLDEVVWTWMGTDEARNAIRHKVAALFPAHEVEMFSNHFWGLVQFWRKTEIDRLAAAGTPLPDSVVATAPWASKQEQP